MDKSVIREDRVPSRLPRKFRCLAESTNQQLVAVLFLGLLQGGGVRLGQIDMIPALILREHANGESKAKTLADQQVASMRDVYITLSVIGRFS
jgi:hypothetical protein